MVERARDGEQQTGNPANHPEEQATDVAEQQRANKRTENAKLALFLLSDSDRLHVAALIILLLLAKDFQVLAGKTGLAACAK